MHLMLMVDLVAPLANMVHLKLQIQLVHLVAGALGESDKYESLIHWHIALVCLQCYQWT